MTITELRKLLEKEEAKGHGDCKICVVSSNCEPIASFYEKYTTDIEPYFDVSDDTFTITD